MALILLIIGAALIIVAVRNSQGDLFDALKQDGKGFAVWAAAIIAIGLIGVVPGLKPISRGILALVIVVIILNNYEKILASFKATWDGTDAKAISSSGASDTAPTAPASDLTSIVKNALGSVDASNSFASASGVGSNG